MAKVTMLTGVTQNTNSAEVQIDQSKINKMIWSANGTWGSATIKLQRKSHDGTWVDAGSSLTQNGQPAAVEVIGQAVRLNIAGGTSATLSATLVADDAVFAAVRADS